MIKKIYNSDDNDSVDDDDDSADVNDNGAVDDFCSLSMSTL